MPIKASADKLKREMEDFGYPPNFPTVSNDTQQEKFEEPTLTEAKGKGKKVGNNLVMLFMQFLWGHPVHKVQALLTQQFLLFTWVNAQNDAGQIIHSFNCFFFVKLLIYIYVSILFYLTQAVDSSVVKTLCAFQFSILYSR